MTPDIQVVLISASGTALIMLVQQYVSSMFSRGLEARKLRAEYVRLQIERVYGPVVFVAELNEALIGRSGRISATYEEYFATRNDEKFEREMESVIKTTNLYADRVVENNQRIYDTFSDNWGFVDDEDLELAREILLDGQIQQLESSAKGIPLPPQFHFENLLKNSLGPKWVVRAGFAARMRERLSSKQRELQRLKVGGLTGGCSWWERLYRV